MNSANLFKADTENIIEYLAQFNEICSNPYQNLTNYESFDSLTGVPINFIISKFDPLLDENIELTKKWKGDIKFDLLDGLPHGFLNIYAESDEARIANELCIQRLRELLPI